MNRKIQLLGLVLLLLTAGFAFGQGTPYSVTVTPEKAELQPGQGLQFEAQLFGVNGSPVDFTDFKWSVRPDSFGTISDDGFFVAGKNSGEGKVVASFRRGNAVFYGNAQVVIGRIMPPDVRVIVVPMDAIVPPGGMQKFHLTAVTRNNDRLKVEHVKWDVKPNSLGKINRDGIFKAGNHPGQGNVIAYVDLGGIVYRGRARVTVSELPTASVSGAANDEQTGAPLIGARILVQRLGPIHWTRRSRTDSLGNYVVNKLIPGLYVVRADAKGYLPEYFDGADHLSEATALQVVADDSLTGIDFALLHGGSISGMVASEADSMSIAHALVTATHVVSQRKRHTLTAEDGSYTLPALAEGDYAVSVRAAGYKKEYYEDARDLLNAQLIRVTPPDDVPGIDLYLATASAIAGHVQDAAAGSAIAHARVDIYNLTGSRRHPRFRTITDKDGDYLASVPPGFYLVYVKARGYRSEFYDNVTRFVEATPVQVFQDQHTAGIDFDLVELGSITGTVVDENTGEPIAGAKVAAFFDVPILPPGMPITDIFNRMQKKPFETRTDSLGQYKIESLHAGKYYVRAIARGYLPEYWQEAATLREATVVEVQDSVQVSAIDFTLITGGTLGGQVADADDSTGLAGAVVTIFSPDKGFTRHVYTNQQGEYHFGGLPTGDYILFAKLKGYDGKFYDGVDRRDEATPIHVEAGTEISGIDFYLPKFITRFGTIAGVVAAELGDSSDAFVPVPGAFVFAIPVKAGIPRFDVSDPLGNYQITNLAPGKYVVVAWASGFIGEFYDNVFDWRDATKVEAIVNQITGGIDFALAPRPRGPYRIRGVVRRRHNQNRVGVSNASVYAFNESGMAASTLTGPNGEFTLDDLPAGEYKIKVTGADIATAYYGGSSADAAQPVGLSGGQSADNVEIDADATTTGIGDASGVLPQEFRLEQNYPNPFNPETTIKFALAQNAHVQLKVYNVLGQVVRTLVNKEMAAGFHQKQWDGTSDAGLKVASGVYLLRFEAGGVSQTRRMLLMK